ncbi:MAG: tol-pal system protein YbgF [Micavibrio sp.]|nr:tol-pal system protein YbgF [Micavibrio sp.]
MMKFFDLSKSGKKARVYPGLLALSLCAVFVLFDGPQALAQSAGEIVNRLGRLEKEVETLSRAVYRGEKPPVEFNSSGGGTAAADTEIRLQQLEGEVRNLRGAMEEKFYELRTLKSEMEKKIGDMELRLQQLEGGSAVSTGGSFTSGSISGGATEAEGGYKYTSKGGASNGKQLGAYVKKPSGALSLGGDDAAVMYENAFSLIKTSNYDAAEREFKAFLQQYPNHSLAPNAKYWLGESFYVRGDYQKSARIFAEGFQQDPKGSKAADNLLKLGLSLAGMGKKEDACVALSQISKENMAGSGPVLRRAAQEQKRLGC